MRLIPPTTLEALYDSQRPLRTLGRLLATGPWSFLLFQLLYFLKHSPALVLPLYLERMIAYAQAPTAHGPWFFWGWTAFMTSITLYNIPGHFLYVWLTHQRIRTMEHRLRGSLVRRLQQLSIAFHTRTESGRIQSKVLRDVDDIVQLSFQLFHQIPAAVQGVLFCVVLVFTRSPVVGLFFVVCAPLAALVIHFFREHMSERNRSFRKSVESMSARISEMIHSIPVTRAHGVEDEEIRRTTDFLGDIHRTGMRLDYINQFFGSSAFVVMLLASILLIAGSSYLAVEGKLPASDIVLYSSLFGMVVGSINVLLGLQPVFSRGCECLRSVGEVLECPDLEHNQGKPVVPSVEGRITFEQVSFAYEGTQDRNILHDFSLDIPAGSCVAFVGESGSGKTTLMNLAIGFWRPNSGRILLDGIDASTIDLRSWRQHIAVVPQHTLLFSGSLRDNITYGRKVDEATIWQAVRAANLQQLIDSLPEGLDTVVGENGMTLSGGQRQRVAIARALVRNPRIIILDEATSALDVVSEREVQEALDHLVAGRTTLIVAHRLSTIRGAQRVVVMKQGRCMEMGSQEELLAKDGEFARLKRLQS